MQRGHEVRKVICPYCTIEASFIDSKLIFGLRGYGKIYYCHKCGAYVGVHKRTNKPLGTLANEELSRKRVETHNAFDEIWKNLAKRKGVQHKSLRSLAYAWLADSLGLKLRDCHIEAIKVCNDNK